MIKSKTYIIKLDDGLYKEGITTNLSDNSKRKSERVSSGVVLFKTSSSYLADKGDRVFFDKNNYSFISEGVVTVEEKFLKLVCGKQK